MEGKKEKDEYSGEGTGEKRDEFKDEFFEKRILSWNYLKIRSLKLLYLTDRYI